MKILAIEKEIPGIKDEDFKHHLKSEAMRIWELYQSGLIREIYFTDQNSAVLLLECKNREEAEDILKSLPLVKQKLIEFNFP